VDLLCTSLGGKLAERFRKVGDRHTRWKGIDFWTDGYEALYEPPPQPPAEAEAEASELATTSSTVPVPKDSVVYLTADSTNVIDEITQGTTYIIGGLVDHNRYKVCLVNDLSLLVLSFAGLIGVCFGEKNLCLEHAEAQGLRHAQLPLGVYLSAMSTRKVLTVNHVRHFRRGRNRYSEHIFLSRYSISYYSGSNIAIGRWRSSR
jgi:hypothetical protein